MGIQEQKQKSVFASKSQVDNFVLPALDMSVMLLSSHLKEAVNATEQGNSTTH